MSRPSNDTLPALLVIDCLVSGGPQRRIRLAACGCAVRELPLQHLQIERHAGERRIPLENGGLIRARSATSSRSELCRLFWYGRK